jgi:hypothetical protein
MLIYKSKFVIVALLILSGCQTNVARKSLVLNSIQFPINTVKVQEISSSALGQQERQLSGSHNGKSFEAAYIKAKSGYVWLRQPESLPEKNLRFWNRMKNESFHLGAYNKIRTSIGELEFRRYKVKQNECVFFGKYFGWSSGDDTRRPTQQINGYFCQKPNEALRDSDISELLHGFSLSTSSPKPQTNNITSTPRTETTSTSNSTNTRPAMERTLQGKWSGVSDDVTGTFVSDGKSGRGKLRVILNKSSSANTLCSGQWLWAKGKYNSVPLPQGTWSIACDDGSTAGGTYISHSPDQGSIEGQDAKGRKLVLTFGSKTSK